MMRKAVLLLAICFGPACGEIQVIPDAVDPCRDAVCECTIATQDTDCGTHEVCDETGPGRQCACAPAYKDQGGACVFDGAPRDRGFTDREVWVPSGGGASIDPAAPGSLDVGEGLVGLAGMCNYDELVQKFTMPPLSKAEPFKLSVTYTGTDPGFMLGNLLLDLNVGSRSLTRDVQIGSYRTDTFCIGAAQYGRELEFRVGTRGLPSVCPPMPGGVGSLNVDQISVLPATREECPEPGTLPNSDFEGISGWSFTSNANTVAAIVPGVGETGSRGAQLSGTKRCSEASMRGLIALPAEGAVINPALDVFYSGTGSGRLTVSFDGKNISVLDAGAARHAKICLPKWALGTTAELGFLLQRNADNACTVDLTRTFVVDNLKIVSDAGCATSDNMDPGFERIANTTGPAPSWGLLHSHVNDVEGGTASIINNSFNAHSGTGVLRLGASAVCVFPQEAGADLTFAVPPAQGAAGPAVRFFAKVPATNANSQTAVFIGPDVGLTLPKTGVYTQHTICIPPRLAGRQVTAHFGMGGLGGGCSTFFEESAFVDDVEVTTSEMCPAQ